jgi:hypothetical protein
MMAEFMAEVISFLGDLVWVLLLCVLSIVLCVGLFTVT